MMTKQTKALVLEMCVGTLLYVIVLGVILWFVAGYTRYTRASLLMGLLVGTVVAILMLIDMGVSTEDAIASKDEKYARNKVMMHSMLRKGLLILAVVVCWRMPQVNVISIALAPIGIKIGAYMQPMVHRIVMKEE